MDSSLIEVSPGINCVILNPAVEFNVEGTVTVSYDSIYELIEDEDATENFAEHIIQNYLKNGDNHPIYYLELPLMTNGVYYNNACSEEIVCDIISDSGVIFSGDLLAQYYYDVANNSFSYQYKGTNRIITGFLYNETDLKDHISLLLMEGWPIILKSNITGEEFDIRDHPDRHLFLLL